MPALPVTLDAAGDPGADEALAAASERYTPIFSRRPRFDRALENNEPIEDAARPIEMTRWPKRGAHPGVDRYGVRT